MTSSPGRSPGSPEEVGDARPARHVLITGGAGDIGRAIVTALARQGFKVTIVDSRPDDDLAAVVDDVTGSTGGADVQAYRVDVVDRAALDALVGDLAPVDIAIANAGIVDSGRFLDISEAMWRRHLDVNLTGVFNTMQSAARTMVANGRGGHIVAMGSWVGSVPWPEIAAYSATKAAIQMLAKSAALELAPHGIRVNVVAPGIVRAGLAKSQLESEPQYAARAARVVPLGDLQTAEQVAEVTAFLCSSAADYMTGTVLLADGGCSLFQFDPPEQT